MIKRPRTDKTSPAVPSQSVVKPNFLQRAAVRPEISNDIPPVVHDVLHSPGQSLDGAARAFMEPRFGRDFSQVRVHTDMEATESARAVGAMSYTVGRDVVFDTGQYAPSTPQGSWLLAHELVHVAQQEGGANTVQTLSLEPVNSRAEAEASEAANAVIRGQAAPPITASSSAMTVRRSVLGAIGGGLLGARAGAGLGFLAGGPVGAVIGGLIGGVAGLIAGETATVDQRPLTSAEVNEAKIVFGNNMNWGKVRLAESAIMSIGGYARTPFNTIYFPPGTLSEPLPQLMPLLIHELTHVWQTQHGISVIEKLFWALHGAGAYNYGDEAGLRRAKEQGKRFTDFNTEQQGDICMDYYVKKKAGQDVSAYEPFIAEVKGVKPPEPGDFPVNTGSTRVV